MSIVDLLSNVGVPGLEIGITLLTETYHAIESIKIYRRQCKDMSDRCTQLLLTLQDSSAGLEGTRAIEIADQVEGIISRMHRRLNEWANLSRLRSLLAQSEIREGIDKFNREIDAAMMRFNININMELSRGNRDLAAIQMRDKAEFRELLQDVLKNTEDVKALLDSRSPEAIDNVMGALQIELHDPSLEPIHEHTFKEGLWKLHEVTSKLPPLTDLTGQVTQDSPQAVAMGNFNDIFIGTWLDRQKVALRRPRALINATAAQNRFQREVRIWRGLRHENIVPFHGVVYIGDNVLSVSSWMDNGTVLQYVEKNPAVDRLKLLSEAAAGLEYLHLKNVVHGDLRGTNVLVSATGVARLSDFGLSKLLENISPSMASTTSAANARWCAPELVKQTGPVSTHSDVWAFGMLALELMTEKQPFCHLPRDLLVIRELDQGRTPQRPGPEAAARGLGNELWALMKRCWHKKPDMRPSMSDVRAKLAEIRGVPPSALARPASAPSACTPPPKRVPTLTTRTSSIFSAKKRPSTADSETSVKSSLSAKLRSPFKSSKSATRITEADEHLEAGSSGELSPISIHTASANGAAPRRPGHRQGSHGDPIPIPFVQEPEANANAELRSPVSPVSACEPRGQRAGEMLGVPGISSSLPSNFQTDMWLRRMPSSDGGSSVAISEVWSDTSSMEGSLRRAVLDTTPIFHLTDKGSMSAGTLEGLIDRLLNHNNLTKDVEYRDILLTTCTDFTTPEELFSIVVRRFNEASTEISSHVEHRGVRTQQHVEIRYNIMIVITYWLSSHHLDLSPQLLWRMKEFAVSALSEKTSSSAMKARAKDILQALEQRAHRQQVSTSPLLSPGRRIPRTSEMLPQDLAIAMTLLEGDKFTRILPSDYIAHLRKFPGVNSVDAAFAASAQITHWVQKSILHYDKIKDRGDVLKFFVNTADECRKLRNFASTAAVMRALQSDLIARLQLTNKELPLPSKQLLDEMRPLFDPKGGDRAYRGALNEPTLHDTRNSCIPWLDLHVQDLATVFEQHAPVVTADGRPLINFERYTRFTEKLKDILYCKPPNLERFRSQGQLAYLEHHLRKIELTGDAVRMLSDKSRAHEVEEKRIQRRRLQELDQLGFRT